MAAAAAAASTAGPTSAATRPRWPAALDLQGAVGVGHSMGAHALVQAAAFAPGRFRQLVLIDPVIRAPGRLPPAAAAAGHAAPGGAAQEPLRLGAGRCSSASPTGRRTRCSTRQALHDYCQHGLKPADDGQRLPAGLRAGLRGPRLPAGAGSNPGIYASIRALQIPVLVLRARPQDPSIKPWDPLGTPTWPALAQEFRHGRDLQLLDKTHMLPMEDPALVARLIAEAMAGYGAP